jgi:hypothetical protein
MPTARVDADRAAPDAKGGRVATFRGPHRVKAGRIAAFRGPHRVKAGRIAAFRASHRVKAGRIAAYRPLDRAKAGRGTAYRPRPRPRRSTRSNRGGGPVQWMPYRTARYASISAIWIADRSRSYCSTSTRSPSVSNEPAEMTKPPGSLFPVRKPFPGPLMRLMR